MLEDLPQARKTFVSALKNGRTCANRLSVVVVRLLAVALTVDRRRRSRDHTAAMAIPKAYRVWPNIESETEVNGSRLRLGCYVCPKGASAADDEPFPVGIVLVVETNVLKGGEVKRSVTQFGGSPRSVFVMGKFASMHSQAGITGAQEWRIHTTYDSQGEVVAADSAACGVCRVPLI